MSSYIIKRLLLFIPTLFIISTVVFVIMRLIPGDPAITILAGDLGSSIDQEQLAKLRAKLGTDKPILVEYWKWISGVAHLDFGKSFIHQTPVFDDIKKKFPVTLQLALMALFISMVVALPVGVFSAVNQDTLGDYAARIITIAGVALPTFWTGILIIYLLVRTFTWLPPLGYEDLWDDPTTNLQQLIFPALALSVFNLAFVARVTRSAMLEVFREDYVRTARSKGLRERVVIARHGLKNAMLPVITISGWQFSFLVGGTVIIEQIFLVPGMGRLLVDSIFQRDYIVTQSVVIVITSWVVLLNLLVDLAYGWFDPRIRYQ